MIQTKHSFFASAGPLLLVLLIDGMGLGLVFPILNGLIFDPQSQILPPALLTPTAQNLLYGGIVGIFMLCWFFGAAILGDLSDRIGRKNSLMICLFGAFLSYLLSAIAVVTHSLSLLIIGRIVAGFTSGSQPIAQAAIIDLSHDEQKTRNIGLILLSLSLGFIIGPLLGGILSDNQIISWFNFSVPFFFAAVISLLNIGLLWWLFNETFEAKHASFAINPYQAINIFVSAFQHEKIRSLSFIFFIFIFGWSSFYSFIAMFLLKNYGFSPTEVSLYMALMGVGFGIGNGYLSNFFAKRFPLHTNFIWSNLVTGIMILTVVFVKSALFSWLMIIPIATTVSIAYTSVLTLFSDQVDANSQGWVMGVTGSILAFVFGIDGIVIGVVATWHDILPIFIAGACLLLTSIITLLFYQAEDDGKAKQPNIPLH
ncbi:MAG: multidrug transporter [uncultured bacterium]|nr:MAG: multidrug transporter [uncultured bacterium]